MGEGADLIPAIGVLLGLMAATFWGVSDFFVAVITRKIGTLRALLIMQTFSAFAFIGFFAISQSAVDIEAKDWAAFVLLSIVVVANYFAFYKALEIGPVAIVTPIVAAYAAVVVGLAMVVLGERLSTGQVIGSVAAIGGVVLASLDLSVRAEGFKVGKGIWLAIASLFGFGITSFVAGLYAQKYNAFIPAVPGRVITLTMFALVAASTQMDLKSIGWKMVLFTGAIGIVEASGFLFFAKGAELGYVSVTAVASAVYPLIPLTLGIIVLKERLAKNQWLGVAAVLAGIALLAVY